ncbi:hypothetical protein SAMN04487950_2024 [Halogranum rubrum]|uniref:Uncharacterized protein n=1 Tax=Halogranum rubrum TaxID=553466 RepID=A0A1I4EDY5_9EURY|nr:DUF5789 family protein [Halogranum rubrum]SFL02586.1 hypothetical protein SAMN04487950_2024 [Halogranum rubrum]
MADEEAEDEAPVVELGEGEAVEGAPLAQVASRLTWPQEKSLIERKEGDAVVRTPSGPQTLSDVLTKVDTTYFDTRQTFVTAIEDVVGSGPVETTESTSSSSTSTSSTSTNSTK